VVDDINYINMKNFIGGLAGAIVLNVLHEGYKRLDRQAPRVDLVGQEALTNTSQVLGVKPPVGYKLFAATLGADIASNAMYYSLIGSGKTKNILLRGAALGIAAGVGALVLTKPMGLDDKPVTKTTRTKALTVAWYLAGGVVAALTIRALKQKESNGLAKN
jgi:hypothetical protein